MTGTELAPMEGFMERVKAKLRDDIGSMLPDEVIDEMVKRAVTEEFFTATRENVGTAYQPKYVDHPSRFQEMVVDAAKPIIERHVLRVMSERKDEIDQLIKERVEAGLGTLALKMVDTVFKTAIESNGWAIQQAVERELQNRGG